MDLVPSSGLFVVVVFLVCFSRKALFFKPISFKQSLLSSGNITLHKRNQRVNFKQAKLIYYGRSDI